jgi:type I restriction enzyme S subunit
VSQLLRGWAKATLADLGAWSGGGTPSKSRPEFWTDGTIPWISPKDMKVALIADAEDHITEAAVSASATNVVPAGSVVAVTRSGILRRAFPVAVTTTAVALNQDLKALRPAKGVDPRYVAWYLRRDERLILHECTKDGTTVDSLDFPEFLKRPIPLAPSAEQQRIVAAIEEQFTRIDAGVALLESAANHVRRLMPSTIFAVIDGDWPHVRLGDVADIALGQQRAPQHHAGTHLRPYIRAANITWSGLKLDDVKRMNFAPDQFPKFELLPGDVLLTEASGSASEVGKPAIWDGSIPGCCFQKTVLRLRSEHLSSEYLYFLFLGLARRGTLTRHSKGVGIFHITKERLTELKVPVPPKTAQETMVETIKQQQSSVAAIIESIEIQLKRAANLRSAILAAAFSGRLVPQDPKDEPASVLLDRITTERAVSKNQRLSTNAAHRLKVKA